MLSGLEVIMFISEFTIPFSFSSISMANFGVSSIEAWIFISFSKSSSLRRFEAIK